MSQNSRITSYHTHVHSKKTCIYEIDRIIFVYTSRYFETCEYIKRHLCIEYESKDTVVYCISQKRRVRAVILMYTEKTCMDEIDRITCVYDTQYHRVCLCLCLCLWLCLWLCLCLCLCLCLWLCLCACL